MTESGKISASALEQALSMAGLGCWTWARGATAPHLSGNFDQLLGYGRDALPDSKLGWLQLAHPDDRQSFDYFFSLLSGDRDYLDTDASIRLRHAQGAWAYFDLKLRRLPPPDDGCILTFKDVTQERQTEAALRDSQLRYRALYSTAPLAFILWNRQGHITEWNHRAEQMFGWSVGEVIGKAIHRLLLPADQHEEFSQAVKQLTNGQGSGEFAGPAMHKDGLLLNCTWYNVALRTPQGTLIGILSLVLDNTEEKLAEQRLQKSEKTYRTLVETSPDAILLLSMDGKVNTANQQAQMLFGIDMLDDALQVGIRSLFVETAEHRGAGELLDNPEDYAGFIVNRDLRMRRSDGSEFDASIAFTTIMDSLGHPSGIVLFARDVTEKLRADRELESHRRNLEQLVLERTIELERARDSLSQIIDGSPVPTFVLDANHVVTHWNKACEGVIGIGAESMIGTRLQWQAFYDSPRPVMADLVISGEMALVEQFYSPKYRRSEFVPGGFEAEDYFPTFKRWLAFTAAPLYDSNGQIIGAIETLQDVSERKQAEIALLDAKSVAEMAAKTKAEFLANMSHEIRTPMNAVIGLAHLLYKTPLSRKQHDYVSRIHGAGQILLGLINDVLDFSKIEAGRMALETTAFELDEVLTNVATVVVTRAQEKGLELQYVVDPEVPTRLMGDPLRLTQILVNLIGNAIKFTSRGNVTAFFRRVTAADSRVVLEIDVQDTGIGMSLEQQSSLFQAFTQADTSITRNYGGTGLGLTISKRLVEMMGGKIWVTSQPDIGSTFSFQISLGACSDVVPRPVATAAQPLRALVVDDNDIARMVLSRLLAKFGCETEEAASPSAAIARLAEPGNAYDYITVDLNMPEMSGLALAEQLQHQIGARTKLVLVTATDTHAMEESGDLRHFYCALTKPITAAQIGELLTGAPRHLNHAADSAGEQLAGMHILLAEDIPTNQLIASEILQSFGATVETADNGQRVLEALIDHLERIDLVLMDVQMPEVDGLQATREIRRRWPGRKLPIVAMTAHALDEERARCLNAGMDDFITKPIDPATILSTLLRWKSSQAEEKVTMPHTSSTETTSTGMPELPGIDTVAGLKRMMNKQALYEKVLKDFHKRFAGEAELIRAALATNDLPTAERHAHSSKGLSGSIGAHALQEASLKLEEALRSGASYPEGALLDYERELTTVLDGIRTAYAL